MYQHKYSKQYATQLHPNNSHNSRHANCLHEQNDTFTQEYHFMLQPTSYEGQLAPGF